MSCVELRIQMLKSGLRNYQIARKLGWHSSKLSSVLNETYRPSSMEKEDLAEVLGCGVEGAFPSNRRDPAHV